jgi:16S rRNA (cytosine967-C5)-methyltransferase
MNPRQLVLFALKDLETGSYTDIVVDRLLSKFELSTVDRHLFTELVNGIVRRKRTLDAIIDQLAKQTASLSRSHPPICGCQYHRRFS